METEKPTAANGVPDAASSGERVDLSSVKKRIGRPPGPNYPTDPRKKSHHGPNEAKKPVATGTADPSVDAAFLSEAIVLLFETGDEIIARTLALKIESVAPDQSGAFMALRQTVGLNDKDKTMLRAVCLAIIKKYNILARFGPEILLLVWMVQYGYRQMKLAQFVNDLAEERKKIKKVPVEPPAVAAMPGPVGTN